MNAKEQMLAYAKKHNTGEFAKMTDAEFCGQMVVEGVCIARTPSSKTIARITRANGIISLTETTITTVSTVENGKLVFSKSEEAITVFEVAL